MSEPLEDIVGEDGLDFGGRGGGSWLSIRAAPMSFT